MKWEDLQAAAQAIVDNRPTGDYVDKTFSTRSGRLTVHGSISVVHVGHDGHYNVPSGNFCATHVTVRCRDTGCRDGGNRQIWQSENGAVFVFDYTSGNVYVADRGELRPPELAAKESV